MYTDEDNRKKNKIKRKRKHVQYRAANGKDKENRARFIFFRLLDCDIVRKKSRSFLCISPFMSDQKTLTNELIRITAVTINIDRMSWHKEENLLENCAFWTKRKSIYCTMYERKNKKHTDKRERIYFVINNKIKSYEMNLFFFR